MGKANYRAAAEFAEGWICVHVERRMFIQKREIPGFFTADFWLAYDLWRKTKLLGSLPLAGGWADQPAHLVELLSAFEAEYLAIQREQAEATVRAARERRR